METKLSELLGKAKETGDIKGLNKIKKYWNWVTAQKTRLDNESSFWKKSYTAIGTVYVGLLLPGAVVFEGIKFLAFTNQEDNKKDFNSSDDGIKVQKEIDLGKKSDADYYDEYNEWCYKKFAWGVGSTSIFPISLGIEFFKGAFTNVDLIPEPKTREEKTKLGKDIKDAGTISLKDTTIYNNALDDKDGKKGFKSWLKTEYYKPTDKFDNEDEALMVQDTTNTNIYYYTPYDNNTKKDLPKLTFEYKDGKFQEKK
jgi:hypothetical protein